MRSRTLLAASVLCFCLAAWAATPLMSRSAPSAAQLGEKITKTQGKVEFKKGKEKVLTRDIAAYTSRVTKLEARLNALSTRQGTIEEDLTAKRTALNATQSELRDERARLVRLQRRFRDARGALEARLVEQYKSGRTDLISVLVEADGFSQLIERGEYLSRLRAKDRLIIGLVADAKKDASATEKKLDTIERRQQKATAAIQARRDEIARIKGNVATVESTVREARNGKRALLGQVKVERKDLEEDLSAMQAQQAKISGALRTATAAGPIKKGTGRLIYPINGTFTSSFGPRWGRLHAGIDVAIPIGTPIRAADGGRVAIAGAVSGYGNYTCVQHSGGLSTCYAHQNSIGVSVGQTVSQGQVIGETGNTGRSTGPHLHFEVRLNGSPVNPMNYL